MGSRPRSPHKGQDSEVRVDKNVYGTTPAPRM